MLLEILMLRHFYVKVTYITCVSTDQLLCCLLKEILTSCAGILHLLFHYTGIMTGCRCLFFGPLYWAVWWVFQLRIPVMPMCPIHIYYSLPTHHMSLCTIIPPAHWTFLVSIVPLIIKIIVMF